MFFLLREVITVGYRIPFFRFPVCKPVYPPTKFKYEGLDVVPQLFSKGDYCITFDLKTSYHHVDIHADCWQYLGYPGVNAHLRDGLCLRCYLGLASACYVFTKLLRLLIKRWRGRAVNRNAS